MSTPAEQNAKSSSGDGSAPTELGKLAESAQDAVNAVRNHSSCQKPSPPVGRALSLHLRHASDALVTLTPACMPHTYLMHQLRQSPGCTKYQRLLLRTGHRVVPH